jgi:hypothetical protein
MKKLFLLCLTVSLFSNLNAQEYEYVPFPTTDAIWSEVFYYPISSSSLSEKSEYRRFAMSGDDTTINGMQYKKLFMFSDSVFDVKNADYIGGIREDSNKRVYYTGKLVFEEFSLDTKGDTSKSEYKIYDFSANIGDTIILDVYLFENYSVVKSIDTLNILGKPRRVYSFQDFFWVSWIEGIGNVAGLLFSSDVLPTNGLYNELVCFEENGTRFYYNEDYGSCRPETNLVYSNLVEQSTNIGELKITPNPSHGHIKVSFNQSQTGTITVYSGLGNVCLSKKVYQEKETEIDVPGKGIFLVKFTNAGINIYSSKLIINQ